MKVEKREVFVAEDGKVFDTMDACQTHEREIAKYKQRLENLIVYIVNSSFDATEGRGYYATTYIITDASYAVVLEYCLDRFGRPLSSWYGDGFYEQWLIRKDERKAIDILKLAKTSHSGVGSNTGRVDTVFISTKVIDHPDMPAPVHPWPKK